MWYWKWPMLGLVLGLGPGLHYTLLTTAQQTIATDGTKYEKICTKLIFILVYLSISIPYFAVEYFVVNLAAFALLMIRLHHTLLLLLLCYLWYVYTTHSSSSCDTSTLQVTHTPENKRVVEMEGYSSLSSKTINHPPEVCGPPTPPLL